MPELHGMEEMLRDMDNDDQKAEVLENVFSLLFVRHVHLQETEVSHLLSFHFDFTFFGAPFWLRVYQTVALSMD